MRVRTLSFAVVGCHSRACAPPPAGHGGSIGGGHVRGSGINIGDVHVTYSPHHPDDRPDPGEIVWARVRFAEDSTQSKDRPVLVIGRVSGGQRLVAVKLTSKSGKPDSISIGKSEWDREKRRSSVLLDRIVVLDDGDYRREGAVMPKPQFTRVVHALEFVHGRRRRGNR